MIRHSPECLAGWALLDGTEQHWFQNSWHYTCTNLCYSTDTGRNKAGVLIVAVPHFTDQTYRAIHARLPSQEPPMPDQQWSVQQTISTNTLTQLIDPDGKVRSVDDDTKTHHSETRELPEHQADALYRGITTSVEPERPTWHQWVARADHPGEPELVDSDPLPWLIHITPEGTVHAIGDSGRDLRNISREARDISHFEPDPESTLVRIVSATDSNDGYADLGGLTPGGRERRYEWCRYANGVLTEWKMSR